MVDKLAGYMMTCEKILEILDKNGIKNFEGNQVKEDDNFVWHFDDMLRDHGLFGENMHIQETMPTEYPRGSDNVVIILQRSYVMDHYSTVRRFDQVQEKEEDMAAKAAFIQRYGNCGVRDEDLIWVTVVDPFYKS